MGKSCFSAEQIVGALKEAEAGVPVKELCRRIVISDAKFYHWKGKYGGLEVNEARRLRIQGLKSILEATAKEWI
jgi:putative transposase